MEKVASVSRIDVLLVSFAKEPYKRDYILLREKKVRKKEIGEDAHTYTYTHVHTSMPAHRPSVLYSIIG